MKDVSKYQWVEYQGPKLILETDHPEFDFELTRGAKLGIRKYRGNFYVVAKDDLDFRFKSSEKDVKKILKKSRGWSGKVKGVRVSAGEGGLDKKAKAYPTESDKDTYVLDIDSSNLHAAWYDKKAKELHVVFHGGAHWAYEEVTLAMAKRLEAAESQGRYFIYKIRDVKPQYKVSD